MLTLFSVLNFQVPSIEAVHLVPVLVLGFLMAAMLCLEIREDNPSPDDEELPSSRSAQVGLGVIALTGLIGYFVSWDGLSLNLTFNDMLYNDTLSRATGLLIAVCALLAILSGPDELERFKSRHEGEFCALIFASALGMTLMVSAANTMVMFLGLELFSIALYLLCIILPDREQSRESGMKYFLLSSAASAVLLYGLALLYGATGTTWLPEMTAVNEVSKGGLALAGYVLALSGFLFKLAIVPFHFWAPDVYEGAPTTVTAFMSVATKVAALGGMWRLMQTMDSASIRLTVLILFSLSVLSIMIGNFMALAQTNVKRMLAYSGVANAGYLLMAPVVGAETFKALLLFLAAYLVANIGAFIALAQIEAYRDKEIERDDLSGLFHKEPLLAASFALCLISLAGLPPAAGFMGKFYLFGQAIAEGQLILPVVGIAGSLVGAGYYLGTAISLFTGNPKDEQTSPSTVPVEEHNNTTSQVALGICVFGVLFLGLFPNTFLNWLSAGVMV
jgi:NADH-quinone oxidoreductase subunit N